MAGGHSASGLGAEGAGFSGHVPNLPSVQTTSVTFWYTEALSGLPGAVPLLQRQGAQWKVLEDGKGLDSCVCVSHTVRSLSLAEEDAAQGVRRRCPGDCS